MNLPPLLARNLRAIARVDPALAARLCEPVVADHLEGDPPEYRLNRSLVRLALHPEEVATAVADVQGRTLIVGVGLGELMVACVKRRVTISAWERDPALLRAALSRHDLHDAIVSRELRLVLGVDLVGLQESAFNSVVHHPVLRQIYGREVRLMKKGLAQRRALICEGGLFVGDVASALESEGFSVYTWDINRLSHGELDRVVERFDPELIFAINHTHGLAEACHRLGRTLIVWEIDPATDHLRRCAVPTHGARIFTYRQANVGRFQAAGFRHVQHLPLAANIQRRTPGDFSPDSEAVGQLCFVGASMVDQARVFRNMFRKAWVEAGGDARDGMTRLDRVLAEQRRLAGNYQIPLLVKAAMPDFVKASRQWLAHDVTAMVAEMAAAERRLNVVAGLGKYDIRVWGDPGWKATEPRGARHMGFAGHNRALTEIYRAGAVQVDIARLYQPDIVPMRIFDILACGGFVIAEYSPGLESLFTIGQDLEVWRTTEELDAKIQHYLSHPDEARAMAHRGMETVRQSHSIRSRVQAMLRTLEQGAPGRSAV